MDILLPIALFGIFFGAWIWAIGLFDRHLDD